jgi:hypothetical protein
LFVPPGVVRKSNFQPSVPSSYCYITTQEDLDKVELAGFERLVQQLKKRLVGIADDNLDQINEGG